MLGAMVNNISPTQTFIVNYTDGSKTTYTQNMSDWYNAGDGRAKQSSAAAKTGTTATARPIDAGRFSLRIRLQIPLNASKTVKNVQLPDTRNIVMLAMDLGTAAIPGTFVYKPAAGTIEPVDKHTVGHIYSDEHHGLPDFSLACSWSSYRRSPPSPLRRSNGLRRRPSLMARL